MRRQFPVTCRYLYHLLDAAGVVRYVGCSKNPYQRLLDHMAECENYYQPLGDWLRDCKDADAWPEVRIVRVVGPVGTDEEFGEVRALRAAGVPILNVVCRGSSWKQWACTGAAREAKSELLWHR